MRKIVLLQHVTADGFVAGTKGEMNWIKLDEELFDLVGEVTREADTALYGRVTYEMMESYWPTAADEPDASKHDREHSAWYKNSQKVVVSNTLQTKAPNTTVINGDIAAQVEQLKSQEGKNILMLGSPRASHVLMEHDLIDEFWLFVNPVLLGEGIPLFANIHGRKALKPLHTQVFGCGVTALHFSRTR